MIGPALQALTLPDTESLSLSSLFSDRIAAVAIWLFGHEQISAASLMAELPRALLVVAGLKASLSFSQWYLWERAGEKCTKSMRADLVRLFLNLNPAARRTDGEGVSEAVLSSTISTDIKFLKEYIVRFYGGMPREGLQVLLLTVTLVLLSPKLFAVFIVGVLPVVLVVSRLGKKIRKRALAALNDYSDLTEWLQQRLLGYETIKHYQTEALEAAKMQEYNDKMFDRFAKAEKTKARTAPSVEFVTVVAVVFVLYYALRQIQTGEATGAIQLSFFSTLAMLSQSAGKLSRYFNSNRQGSAAAFRIQNLWNHLAGEQKELIKLPCGRGKVTRLSLSDVAVKYDKVPALKSFTYEFEQSRIYCICGHSGAGKSTLFNAILGLASPSRGRIAATSPTGTVCIGYMPQFTKLLPGTVAENVAYPNDTSDLARADEALKAVRMLDIVRGIDGGVGAKIGEGGRTLSGGQVQRVHLARLFYHRPEIVLVDEGTSALDPENEKVIYDGLRELASQGSIVVMIAHRSSATQIADEILLLKGGALVQSGESGVVKSSREYREYCESGYS